MPRRDRRGRRGEDYGERWEIAVCLTDGPRTLAEIADHSLDFNHNYG